MIVYKITNIFDNKIYVGQTSRSLEIRWAEHCTQAFALSRIHKKTPLHNAISKYGKDGFNCEILATATSIEELNELEIYFISKLDSLNKSIGYNLSTGGKNSLHSLDTKIKISAGHLGKTLNDATKEKLRKINLGKKHSKETIEKIKASAALTGGSVEFKNKMSQILIEQWKNEDRRTQYSNKCQHKKRIVDQYGVEYESISLAAKILELKAGKISDNLNGRINSTRGYSFKFIEENND